MAQVEATSRELRIAVVMSGGVSLAIWMGGVAHELLRFVHEHDRTGIGPRPSIDVITGTSAGGLNGAFLAAALAWGIGPKQFQAEVRNTWLQLGSIEHLLRSPLEPDPRSLFDGDNRFQSAVSGLLKNWFPAKECPATADDFRIHLVMTTTLLTPEFGAYFDDLGFKMVEPTSAGTFTFTREDFLDKKIVSRMALAARSSSSYPVAFEPAFVSVGNNEGEIPPRNLNFKKARFVVDGGVIVNRPLRHALEGIIRQPATNAVDRWIAYVVPDPDPTDAVVPDVVKSEPYTIAAALGKVAAAGFSQSLTEDLREWEAHRIGVSRQKKYRHWLAGLTKVTRKDLVNQLYSMFKERRAEESALYTVREIIVRTSRDQYNDWDAIQKELVKARLKADWHPPALPIVINLTIPWEWGVASLDYMAQAILELVNEFWAPKAAAFKSRIHQVLAALRTYRELDKLYWTWAFNNRVVDPDLPAWAETAYKDWPRLTVEPGSELATEVKRIVGELRQSLSDVPGASEPLARPPLELTQPDFRMHLTEVAKALASAYSGWLALGLPVLPPTTRDQREVAGVAKAIGNEGPGAVLRNLLDFWIMQAATQPRTGVEWEQKINLAQISADIENLLARNFKTAADKLTGVQLAHFGAFYKRSWRASDWMWGRLDGLDRVTHLAAKAVGGIPDVDGVIRQRQETLLAVELVGVADAMDASHADEGGLLSLAEKTFIRAVRKEQQGNVVPAASTPGLLRQLPIGRIGDEVGADQFVRTVTKTAAVAATTVSGKHTGLGSLRHLFGQVRNLVVLPFYFLAQIATTGSSIAGAVAIASLLLAAAFVIIDIALPSATLPSWLLALSWVDIAFWAFFALSRARDRWRRAFAILALVPFGVLAIAYAADWVAGGVASSAQGECTGPVSELDVRIEDGEFGIVVDNCRPLAADQTLPAARGSRLRHLVALAGVAAAAVTALLPLLWSKVPSFSAGLAVGLLGASLWILSSSGWLIAAVISTLVLAVIVGGAVLVMRAPSRPLVLMGALSGGFSGGAGIAAVRIGEDLTPNPTAEAAIGWMVASPGWALIVAVVLPTLLSALAGWISARTVAGTNLFALNRKPISGR